MTPILLNLYPPKRSFRSARGLREDGRFAFRAHWRTRGRDENRGYPQRILDEGVVPLSLTLTLGHTSCI